MTEDTSPAAETPKKTHPRVVLAWILVVILVAIGLYAVAPWILPVRIIEGPFVQMPDATGLTIVWYTTKPAECTLSIEGGDESRVFTAQSDGRRNRVRVDGLQPDGDYPYTITANDRVLATGLSCHMPPPANATCDFFVFGDSGKGTPGQYGLADRMASYKPRPDFLVHTGDMVYSDGARRRYEARFFTPYRAMIARACLWPCVGNHDLTDDSDQALPYQEVFEAPNNGPPSFPPDANYWFDTGMCRFVIIDSNKHNTEEVLQNKIAPWVREVLGEPGPRWKFVSMHHPPYTGGKYQPDVRIQKTLVPVFEEVGVDIVFCGHDHMYQRMHPLKGGRIVEPGEGILYIITAAGGARLYEPRGPMPEYVAFIENETYNFTHVRLTRDKCTLQQITLEGKVLDEYTIERTPVTTNPVPESDAASSGIADS